MGKLTADAWAEVERLRGELERSRYRGCGSYPRAIGEIECMLGITGVVPLDRTVQAVKSLTEQLAEATGLLRKQLQLIDMVRQHPLGVQMMQRTLEEWSVIHAFLSRAQAQAAEPTMPERIAAAYGAGQSEAESKLTAVRGWAFCGHLTPHQRWERIAALLAPSQGEGGGGNG
jgi:hypothetical protein